MIKFKSNLTCERENLVVTDLFENTLPNCYADRLLGFESEIQNHL